MSISKTQIQELIKPVSDRISEGYLQMRQLSDEFYSFHHPSSVLITMIQSVLANARQVAESYATSHSVTDEMLDETRSLLPTYDDLDLDVVVQEGCTLNAVNTLLKFVPHTFTTERYSYPMMAIEVQFNNEVMYLPTGIHRDMVNEVFVVPTLDELINNHYENGVLATAWHHARNIGLLTYIQTILNEAASGVGENYFFASVLSYAADHAFDDRAASSLSSYISGFTDVSKSLKDLLLSVSLTNPLELVSAISNYIKQSQQAAEANDPSVFSDTKIAMRTYVNGVLIGTAYTALTVLTAVATAINRIASVVMSAIGSIISIFSNLYYRTQDASLNFGINIKANHCFDFIVSQSKVNSGSIRQLMISLGVNSLVVTPKDCPSVFSIFLCEDDDDYVLIEERLSCDYDLTLTEKVINLSAFGSTLTFHDGSGFICPIDFGYDCGVLLVNSSSIYSLACTSKSLAHKAYLPFNISRLSGVFNSVTGVMNVALARRLASAVILWCYPIVGRWYQGIQLALASGTYECSKLSFARQTGSTYSIDMYGFNVIADCFNKALFALLGDSSATTATIMSDGHGSVSRWTSTTSTYHEYNGSYIQSWIENEFVNCFSGLSWMDKVHSAIDLYDQLCAVDLYYRKVDSTITSGRDYVLGQFYFTEAAYLDMIYVCTEGSFYLFKNYLGKYITKYPWLITSLAADNAYWTSVTGWITEGSITLPSVTWSAVVLSIVSDVACLIGIAAVAAGALVGRAKITSYRARKQAAVEANWYAYQDALSAEYATSEDRRNALNTAWSKYNSSRVKYNILARLTGGTVLAKGLYDDGSSGSAIESIRALAGGSSDLDLADIVNSIDEGIDSVNENINSIHELITG